MNKRLTRDDFEFYLEIETETGEDYEYQMLLMNKIDYILPVNILTVNEKRKMIYSAAGYKPLEHNLERRMVTVEQVLCMIESILDGVETIKKYLLLPNSLVLQTDCIFLSSDHRKSGLVYVPGYNKDIILQLRELMEILSGRIDQNDVNSIMLSWRLHMLLKEEHVTLTEIRKVLNTYDNRKSPEIPHFIPARNEGSGERTGERIRERTREKQNLIDKRLPLQDKRKQKTGAEILKEKTRGNRFPIYMYVCIALTILAAVSEVFILGHIYLLGITFGKRNLLIGCSLLLFICLAATITLWKKEKIKQQLRSLQQKAGIMGR